MSLVIRTLFRRLTAWAVALACVSGSLLLSVPVLGQAPYDWTYTHRTATSGTMHLWVPEQATAIRALILASEGRLTQLAGDTAIRSMCRREQIGIIGFRGMGFEASFGAADRPRMQEALDALAQESGFPEVAFAPWVSYGTSVGGIFAWQIAAVIPERTLAIIEDNANYISPTPLTDQIPVVFSRGSAEQVQDRWPATRDSVMTLRRRGQPATMLLQAGCGHFAWTAFEARYLSAFIAEVTAQRMPPGVTARQGVVPLRPVSLASGAVTDTAFTSSILFTYSPTVPGSENRFYHLSSSLAQLWSQLHVGQFQRMRQAISSTALPACPQAFSTCTQIELGSRPGNRLAVGATSNMFGPVRLSTYNGAFKVNTTADTITLSALHRHLFGETGWVVAVQESDIFHQCAERVWRIQVTPTTTGVEQPILTVGTVPDQAYTAPPFLSQISSPGPSTLEHLIECGAVTLSDGVYEVAPFPRGTSLVRVWFGHSGGGGVRTTPTPVLETFRIRRLDTVTAIRLPAAPAAGEDWHLAPNPTAGQVRLMTRQGSGPHDVTALSWKPTIYDRLGRQWHSPALSGDGTLDLSGLPPGMYRLELQGPEGQRVRTWVVRQ